MTTTVNQPIVKNQSATAVSQRRKRAQIVLLILCLILIAAVLAGVGIGAVQITPSQLGAILLDRLGIPHEFSATYGQRETAVLLTIRMPRVILGLLIGAALGISGAAIQGLFRNPLAAPGLIGVSSGAGLAAVLVIVLGATLLEGATQLFGRYTLPLAAFLGGALTTLIIYRLSTVNGRTQVGTMLLAGVAINALAGAAIGFMTFIATDEQLRSITFWNLGSLGGATWKSVSMVTPLILLPLILLPLLAKQLNALILGEAEAGHLGIHVETTKRMTVLLVALAVGASVSVAGAIGFIGLVVPHLLRLMVGPNHRVVLPGAALLGAIILLFADLLARTVAVPAEIPIGILTAVLGAPFFLCLLIKQRNRITF